MFRIKICGITNVDDARAAVDAGADAIGLNFYPKSSRFIDLHDAQQIVDAVPTDVIKVGVWVNAPSSDIGDVFDRLALDLIQLHGDEPPEFCRELGQRPILRAFRCCATDLQPIREYLDQCHRLGAVPRMVLADSFQPGHYGGTGIVADWTLISADRDRLGAVPLVLAGGLGPHNVAAAIATARPNAVDTASGVEESPRRKSPELIRAFVRAAAEAFSQLHY